LQQILTVASCWPDSNMKTAIERFEFA